MKNFMSLLFGIIFSNMIFAQTFNVSFNDIYSTDSLSAWVVGDEGTILHIIDGGTSFEDHSFSTELSMLSVCFPDLQHGFVIGGNLPGVPQDTSIVIRTTDGGDTWSILDLPGGYIELKRIHFVDDLHGWITSSNLLYRTVDGGNTWTLITNFIGHVSFIDANIGWSATYVQIQKTYDGGLTWTFLSNYSGGTGGVHDIQFIDEQNGLYTSNNMSGSGLLFKTIDGGNTWDLITYETWGNRLNLIDLNNGWISDNSAIFYSSDFFETWESFSPPNQYVNSISVNGYSNGWAVCNDFVTENGSVWKLDGINNWVQIDLVSLPENDNSKSSIKCFPNPFAEIVTIELEMNNMENIKISIHDQLGKEIETLFEGKKNKKTFQLTWDSGNLPTGVYLLKLQTENDGITTQKIIKK